MNRYFNKFIWFFWYQDFNTAPQIVKYCYNSWKNFNPDWEIIFLNKKNLFNYISIEDIIARNKKFISIQSMSDIIRINLLQIYGGVWVDSTCLCTKPLDTWLFNYLNSGFFAFKNPGIDRPLSSWFLAANINSPLVKSFCSEVNNYWLNNLFNNQYSKHYKIIKIPIEYTIKKINYNSYLHKILFKTLTSINTYPYFWFHYIFANLLNKDSSISNIWYNSIDINADIPHELIHIGLQNNLNNERKNIIDISPAPLFKLNWRVNITKNSILEYVIKKYS